MRGSAQDVALYSSPWVSSTAAEAYYGAINETVFVPDGNFDRVCAWEEAADALLSGLQAKAWLLGANAVVGVEITADPFWENPNTDKIGCRLQASGTAAKLRALY